MVSSYGMQKVVGSIVDVARFSLDVGLRDITYNGIVPVRHSYLLSQHNT